MKPNRHASSTETVHAGAPSPRPHHALSASVVQTATFTFDDTEDLSRFMRGEDADPERQEYGRYGNPTVREFERRTAALEGAEDAVAYPSGMAAVAGVMLALLKASDHVVLFNDCYRRTRQLVAQTFARFGIEHTAVPAGDLEACEQALRPNTRLIVSESPTNPYLYCVDLERLARIAKAHGRVRTVVDSTFATPVNSRPLERGIDLVLHSATKYLGGHNDVLGGIVAGSTDLVSLLRDMRGITGAVMDPHAAFLIIRGIKSLGVRMARHNETALSVARALESHPAIERVYYPGLASHPSHDVASAQMSGHGGVVSFVVRGGREAAARVVDGVKLARIAPSFGGVEALIEQPANMSYFEFSEDELREFGIEPGLVRLAVGLEDTEDLLADVVQALGNIR
jgi:cystathionine gamma-synthase